MIRRIYKKVLRDFDEKKQEILQELRGRGTNVIIPDDAVIERSHYSRWLIKRAQKWEEDRKRFGG